MIVKSFLTALTPNNGETNKKGIIQKNIFAFDKLLFPPYSIFCSFGQKKIEASRVKGKKTKSTY